MKELYKWIRTKLDTTSKIPKDTPRRIYLLLQDYDMRLSILEKEVFNQEYIPKEDANEDI
jgi:hypothetical protein